MNRSPSFRLERTSIVVLAAALLGGCGESSSSPEIVDYTLVSTSSAGLTVNATLMRPSLAVTAGDVLSLRVVGMTAEGIAVPAPEAARVAWSGLQRLVVGDFGAGPSPVMASEKRPSGVFIDNAIRFGSPDDEALVALLDVNAEALTVTAELSGVSGPSRQLTGSLIVSEMPDGDVKRGQTTFSENCTSCHGTAGSGGKEAPRLTGTPAAMASDAGWTAPVFAVGARVGMDARGVLLRNPMPVWFAENGAHGQLLSTRDFADVYAFLRETSGVSPQP